MQFKLELQNSDLSNPKSNLKWLTKASAQVVLSLNFVQGFQLYTFGLSSVSFMPVKLHYNRELKFTFHH